MLTKDIYGKTLSSDFNSAIESYSQFVKPKITVKLLDSRHLEINGSITNSDNHSYSVVFNSTNDTLSITNFDFYNGSSIKFSAVPANSAVTVNQEYFIINANNTSKLYQISSTRDGSPVDITANGNATVDNSSIGSLGYYFTEKQAINGYERQSFTWAVCDAKEKDGSVIKADGTWHAMPSGLDDDYEFGWWTGSKSQSNGVFSSPPVLTIPILSSKINKIKIVTSEFYGQIKECIVVVSNTTYGNFINKTLTFGNDEYFKEIEIKSNNASNANYVADQIVVTINSTKNGNDHGRIQEICPYYEVDITDYIIDFSVNRSRDVHESSLPIAGTQNSTLSISIDNTNKDWNIFNTNSLYGKYMKKDLKINVSAGWKIKKTDDIISSTNLSNSLSNSATTINVVDTDIFPNGGANNYYIITIDPDNENKEIILCNTKTDNRTITVIQRGYANTDAVAHSSGAVVQFDPYEYIPMGEFYVDEWTSSTSDMVVNATASDWGKFLNEKTLSKGFLFNNVEVGEVVENLLLRSNFPKNQIKYIKKYSKDISQKGGIARYSFNETPIDRDGSDIELSDSLRCRFWVMDSGDEHLYKEIYADMIEKELSTDEIIKKEKSKVLPTYVNLSKNISTTYLGNTGSLALNNYSVNGTYQTYFNGVIDGYYIPSTNGNQDLIVDIQNGGARVYLDDTIVAENWKENTTLTSISAYTYRGNSFLNLTAGTPYRIRIEFFHGPGAGDFNLRLFKDNSSLNNKVLVAGTETKTLVARDSIGYRNANFNTTSTNFNHHQNDGVYYSNVQLTEVSEILSENTNYSVFLQNGGYIRIPNHTSINLTEKDFSFELYAKFSAGAFSSDGEYISSWSNSSPTSGFEFYSNSSSHGFKVITSSGTETVSNSLTALSSGYYSHIIVTYKSNTKSLKYYVDGVLKGNSVLSGNISSQLSDITIGGRGSAFSAGSPVAPSVTRELFIDEFAIYKTCLSENDILERYYSSQIEKLPLFAHLYGVDETIRQSIDSISLAGMGRFYIDEENNARYEHYKRFFETFIDQHANVQYNFSGNTNIISSNLQVQLQTNKVTIKVPQISADTDSDLTLWQAEDPTTLVVTNLETQLLSNDDFMNVLSTSNPKFWNSGYVIIDDEIIKYNSINGNQLLGLERGQLGTISSSHVINSKVREVKVYDIKYDKSPAYSIQAPLVTAITRETPDLINILKFDPGPYGANLILAASKDVAVGGVVFIEGNDAGDNSLPYYTSIAGVPVISSQNSEQVSDQTLSLSDNIRKYGLKEIIIDNKFITDIEYAKELCSFIINKMSEPVPILDILIMSVPKIQLGDRVQITTLDSFDIINGEYWVVSQNFSYSSGISHSLILRKVPE